MTAPIEGATIGAMMKAAITRDRILAICGPVNRSRTIARASTEPAPAPIPSIARQASRASMLGARAQPTVAIR